MDEEKEFKVRFEDLFSELIDSPPVEKDTLAAPKEPHEKVVRPRQARKQEETIFRAVVENVLDAVFISNLEGVQTYSNRACYATFGYDYESQEMRGLPLSNLWPEKDISILVGQVLPQAVTGGWKGNVQQKRRDGSLFDAHLTVFPVKDGTDRPHSIAAVIRDIPKYKRPEPVDAAAYEHRIRQVQFATEVAQEIAAAPSLDELYHRVVDLVKERFGYRRVRLFCYDPTSDAMVLFDGRVQTGIKTRSAAELPRAEGIVETAATTGQPVLVADVRQTPGWQPQPGLPDTKSELAVPIKLRDRVLGVLDVHGSAPGDLTQEDEISLLNLASQVAIAIESVRLMEEANAFRQFARASEGVSWFTLEGHIIIYANPALSGILGVARPEDTFGKPITAYYPEELRERVQNEVLPAVMQQGHWVGELAFRSAQGKITPTMQSIFLIRDEGGTPLYLANVTTDITEQKHTEAVLDRRARQIRCLNDLGQKIEQAPHLPEFLQWVAERIPSAMQYPDLCLVAAQFNDQVYGEVAALDAPCRIAEHLRIGDEAVGQICIAYTQERDFVDEETTLLCDIVRRVNGYLESRYLFEQAQTTLDEVKAAHRLYMPERWDELSSGQASEEQSPQDDALSESGEEPEDDSPDKRMGATLRKTWQRISTGLFVAGILFLPETLFAWTGKV